MRLPSLFRPRFAPVASPVIGETAEVEIEFEEGESQTIYVTPLGESRYRLEEFPLTERPVSYGDVIEATPGPDNIARFRRVIESAGYRKYCFILHPSLTDSPRYVALLDKVMEQGGNWQRDMGGVLQIALPSSSRLRINAEIRKIARHSEPQ